MKLSDFKGEKALDMLADLIEPATEIMTDKEIVNAVKSGQSRAKLVKSVIKNHKKAVIEILAILDEDDPKRYAEKVNLFTLPARLLEIFNDPELANLFTSQGQKMGEANSGSATESIGANEQ